MPMTATTIENDYNEQIKKALPYCLTETNLAAGKKYQGKVRDTYDLGEKLILITTDRQSAFDASWHPCRTKVTC
jgi:phosphoribosylaminoimidazole-succinocarboxamide synthase